MNGSCNYNPDMCRKGIGCFNFLVRHSSLFLHTIRPLAMGNVLVDKGPLLLNSVLHKHSHTMSYTCTCIR